MNHHIQLRGFSQGFEGQAWQGVQRLRIGRGQRCEVLLSDTSMSRRHAEMNHATTRLRPSRLAV
jgi:hypothetical protein